MIKNKTLIIVGAGASHDLGLPVGQGLQARVAQILTNRRLEVRAYIREAATIFFDKDQDRADKALGMGEYYAPRMLSAASIDNFLDQHKDNDDLVSLMKIAIAYAIAEAENSSKIGKLAGDPVDFINATRDYFLFDFLNIVVRNHQLENLDESLSNLCFVTFNYDRCVERYLESWLVFRFGPHAKALASIPKILHVYGSLGDYTMGEQRQTFEYSGKLAFQNPHFELPSIAPRIKLFTEQEDSSTRDEIESRLKEAQTLLFLGFGFEEQNMRFFSVGDDSKRVFSTFFGMSQANTEHLSSRLVSQFSRIYRRVFYSNDKCKKMMEDFYHPLTEAVGSI